MWPRASTGTLPVKASNLARGLVATRPEAGAAGHVFNIVNHQGRVLFSDVQTGFVDPMLYKTFKLMRTN
ncbi:toxin glutamine deamidase domain-containing protein [Streptomyces sp. CSDS2]|uniref:toxin glutamine deamidase domain-containing protein n=1 Tax=Streptomyces sp. CSDS2 TaxID=3055051 RepID=UPI0025AF5D82|nr:toxin glutamine deamidase domain-containing protein [Streptomyces sp. CSDS2]MDN3265729.1 toxin glutamine deamidase domain-containing protein [Streptomyces sp. CSDS2]